MLPFLMCSLLTLPSCVCLQIFEQFVKTRIKEEYKEKKSKLLLAKEEFRKLLEESKVSPRYGERYTSNGRGWGAPWTKPEHFPAPGHPSSQAQLPPGHPREAVPKRLHTGLRGPGRS